MNEVTPQEKFKKNINVFFSTIIDIIEEVDEKYKNHFSKKTTIESIQNLMNAYDIEVIMSMFINKTSTDWIGIKNRNINVCKKFQEMLESLPIREKNNNTLVNIMSLEFDGKQVVSDENREKIWSLFESFVYILVAFVHETREPKTKISADGSQKPVYCKKFIPTFNVIEHAKTWNIELRF